MLELAWGQKINPSGVLWANSAEWSVSMRNAGCGEGTLRWSHLGGGCFFLVKRSGEASRTRKHLSWGLKTGGIWTYRDGRGSSCVKETATATKHGGQKEIGLELKSDICLVRLGLLQLSPELSWRSILSLSCLILNPLFLSVAWWSHARHRDLEWRAFRRHGPGRRRYGRCSALAGSNDKKSARTSLNRSGNLLLTQLKSPGVWLERWL